MKTRLLIIYSVGSVLLGCNQRGNFQRSFLLNKDKGLFIESYSAGLIGNLTSDYATDSSHFRVCLGTFDPENEIFHIKVEGDSIIALRKYGDRTYETAGKTISRKSYALLDLIKERRFD